MSHNQILSDALDHIFTGIQLLCQEFPHKDFTIDGRLVGDIGEIIASLNYDIELYDVSQPDYDGFTSDGRKVQIKCTFKDSLTFRKTPDYYLGLKIYPDGSYSEIYNGPGYLIFQQYQHRSGIGKQLLSFPNINLKSLSNSIPITQKIPKR